ncbi:MAG: LemA family protein [Desulfuromonas sp.]|uniref:LemA family protein n=1 Tax=Desulfuromonas sp. TaxID=892 RepID=UPI000CCB6E59|nr:LemA family protein [Desulfuromonas sp.]PLX82795.1 MAG: LemA family protein [Desulfuromonas sp.]
MIGWIVLVVLLLLLVGTVLYAVMIYNGFIRLKNNIDRDWSNIDVLLKQRYDELPKLIKVCEGYMQHERQTLEAVIQARSQIKSAGNDEQRMQAQNMLTDTLRSLFAVVERYPELKADKLFRSLSNRISELEDQIADRREFYNESVNIYNIRLDQFPDVLIARFFTFARRPLWKIDPAHRTDVEVSFGQG